MLIAGMNRKGYSLNMPIRWGQVIAGSVFLEVTVGQVRRISLLSLSALRERIGGLFRLQLE
jgi:hypothetical protein